MLTAQSFFSAYSICFVICASVRSGRNENWPYVTRLPWFVIMAAFSWVHAATDAVAT